MKVLILHQHFKTPQRGGAIRSYYLAKALQGRGFEVCIITGHNHSQFKREITEGIEIQYLPVPYDNRFGFTARVSSFLKYILGVIRRTNTFRDADICYAISVPLTIGLAALWIKWRLKIPYIFEVGDLWPEAPIQMGVIKNPLLKRMLFTLEKKFYGEAKCIVALSLPIQKAIQQKINTKPVHIITNMADDIFFKPASKTNALERKFGVEGKFVVSYIGALGLANGLNYFLECARASQRAQLQVHFLLCGDGAMLVNLKNAAGNLHLTNLSFVPFQNRDGVKEVMNVTDACFVCYKSVPVLETGSPNKYFDALASGKLIVINFSGWIKEEIEKEHCGIFIDPQQPIDFVTKISPFLNDTQRLNCYQQNGRTLAETKYSRSIVGEKFVKIF